MSFNNLEDLQEEEYIAEESRDVTPEPPKRHDERVPDMQLGKCRYVRLHDNINYVASAIILREHNGTLQVLLIQEAKKNCYGKWYIPAGRVEAGETLEEAVQREVLEETGYNCEVVELLSMQVQGSGWYRFCFVANIRDGQLKTTPDIESLCAQWFNVDDVKNKKLEFRGKDFLRLLDEALVYRECPHLPVNEVSPCLPINLNIKGLFIEFMIFKHSLDETRVEVLVHRSIADETMLLSHDQPFPTVEFGFEYFFAMVVSKCYKHLLEEGGNVVFSPSHITRVKCLPAPMESLAHGLQVRLACEHRKMATKASVRSPSRYHWISVSDVYIRRQLRLEKGQYRPSLHML